MKDLIVFIILLYGAYIGARMATTKDKVAAGKFLLRHGLFFIVTVLLAMAVIQFSAATMSMKFL